jgi:N6-L-threonylcarbamoyladenine synthase
MRILSIETSCDETAISIIDAKGGLTKPVFKVLGNKVSSQAAFHAQFGGVFPAMAKREHSKNIFPLFVEVLKQAKLFKELTPPSRVRDTSPSQGRKTSRMLETKMQKKLTILLTREHEVMEYFESVMPNLAKPKIDAIAVTYGPGLEPALWVGLTFAKALSLYWDIPLVPVNHMEGHMLSVLLQPHPGPSADPLLASRGKKYITPKVTFPALALLISGGHTELVHIKDWMKYKLIGQTRDDAVGEAFDKVARMLDLPYPGGPEVSRLAEKYRKENPPLLMEEGPGGGGSEESPSSHHPRRQSRATPPPAGGEEKFIILPRPMLHSKDFDFSFSGLKTAVLYMIRDLGKLDQETKEAIACEFEDAVTEVIVKKTMEAAEKTKAKTIIVGGGVAANKNIKSTLQKVGKEKGVQVLFPEQELATDNSLMIGIAGYFRFLKANKKGVSATSKALKAKGNLAL